MSDHPRGKKAPKKLAALIKAFESNRDEEAIALARALLKDPDPKVSMDASRILAVCLFQQKSYEEASALWVVLFEKSDDPTDWVSVVTSSIMARKFDEADRYFKRALEKFNQQAKEITQAGTGWHPGMHTGPQLLGYYASACADAGESGRALPKLKELAELFAALSITDDTFVAMRGMPSFGSFCQLVERIYPSTPENPIWTKIFQRLTTALDPEGRSSIEVLQKTLQRPE